MNVRFLRLHALQQVPFWLITVFLSHFLKLFKAEVKFSKELGQTVHHLVTSAHHKSNFSFFSRNCKGLGIFTWMIKFNCLLVPTLSSAHAVLISKCFAWSPCWIILCHKTTSHWFTVYCRSLHAKQSNQLSSSVKHLFQTLPLVFIFCKSVLNWWTSLW